MDVRRLELLLALSRQGSMHAVSETHGVTTSTVSQQIAALAKEVGTPLLEPDGRRVRLTPAGRRLAGHAVHILVAHEAARADLDPSAKPTGTVRVAAFHTAIRETLLPVAHQLAAEHPAVRLEIQEQEPPEALAMLDRDQVVRTLAAPAGVEPHITQRADSLPLVQEMILAGLGVALLPSNHPKTAGISLRRLRDPEPRIRAHALTRRGRSAWPPLRLLLTLLTG